VGPDAEMRQIAAPSGSVVGLLTCSFRGDLDLFGLLAESIERFVTPSTPHVVLVPRRDVSLFRRFASNRREIHEQEAFLPRGLVHAPLPSAKLRRRLGLSTRDHYFSWRTGLVRGWIVQQMMKLEAARRMPWDAVLHLDSDAAFIRSFDPRDIMTGGSTRLYRIEGAGNSAMHAPWHLTAGRLLGLPLQSYYGADYIENMISWRPSTVQMLADHISRTTQRDWMHAIAKEKQISEYVLYGVFWDRVLGQDATHTPSSDPLCLTIWTEKHQESLRGNYADQLRPHHVAIGIQSTIPLSIEERRNIINRCAAAAEHA
jgi:hypothetical protein